MKSQAERKYPVDYTDTKGGKWRIDYDPKPIPIRTSDYDYWHDDYDGAPDAGDNRCGSAASIEACISDIEEIVEED